jgi:hypothetical protein
MDEINTGWSFYFVYVFYISSYEEFLYLIFNFIYLII